MTPDKTREAIEVMKAFAEGKQIQTKTRGWDEDAWYNIDGSCGETPAWEWVSSEYRVAPVPAVPVATEWWVIVDMTRSNLESGFQTKEEAQREFESWYDGATEPYQIKHVRVVSDSPKDRVWKIGDRVVLARLSSEEEYEADKSLGWADELEQYIKQTGTIIGLTERSNGKTAKVQFEDDFWHLFTKDLDPA